MMIKNKMFKTQEMSMTKLFHWKNNSIILHIIEFTRSNINNNLKLISV